MILIGRPAIEVHSSRRPAGEDNRVFLLVEHITGVWARESTLAGTREKTISATITTVASGQAFDTVETYDEVIIMLARAGGK